MKHCLINLNVQIIFVMHHITCVYTTISDEISWYFS